MCIQEKIEKGNASFLLIYPYHRQVWKASSLGSVTPALNVDPSAPTESPVCYRNTIPKFVWDSTEKGCLTQASLKEKASHTRKSPILSNTCRNLTVDINRKVGLVVCKGVCLTRQPQELPKRWKQTDQATGTCL